MLKSLQSILSLKKDTRQHFELFAKQNDIVEILEQKICDSPRIFYALQNLEIPDQISERLSVLISPKKIDKQLRNKIFFLQSNGVEVFLDNFTISDQQISALKNLELTGVRIPARILQAAQNNASSKQILQFAIQMCEAIDLEIIVNDISSTQIAQFSWELGVHYLQGNAISPKTSLEIYRKGASSNPLSFLECN